MSYPIRVGARAIIIEQDSILLVECEDATGLHYNLPGGGVEAGESIVGALRREVREEASAEIEVGSLLFVIEYEPNRNAGWAGSTPVLSLIFDCQLSKNAQPALPEKPDAYQTGVKWIKLTELESVELLPHISDRIIAYARHQRVDRVFLEEPVAPDRIQKYLK
jgi:8-oxo-dGTP diphosphatase